MSEIERLPCDLFPVADGVLVVPYTLPFLVPDKALPLTVAEWLGVTPG
ncbi:hypothetical protein [Nonomuraea sp. SYSU D8015]|nr:hypothetical protein [Nonomuraea sp. SYSU D8015]